MDDLSLLRDYAETGSSRAFGRLVERHVDLVYSAALRRMRGDPHRAAEVTQMVFVDLARKAVRLTRHPLLAGWLHQSTRWAAASVLRAEGRRQAHESAAAAELEWAAANSGTGAAADWGALRPLLDDALDQLRESDRQAVLLRFFSHLAFAEIAARLGIRENAARMRVERALEKLHRVLRQYGITSSSAALAVAMSQHAVAAAPSGMAATLAPVSLSTATATLSLGAAVTNFLMTKVQLGLLAVLAAALAIGLSFETAARTTESDALNRVRQQRDARRTELAKLETRAAIEQQTLQNLPSVVSAPPPDPVQVERKRLDLIIRKGELDFEYAALFRRLKLDGPTLNLLKTRLVERNQALFDAGQVANAEGVTIASYAELREFQQESAREVDRQIASLLGAEKFDQFNRYLSTKDFHWLFSEPGESVGPESDRRIDTLVELFENTCPDYFDKAYASEIGVPVPEEFLVKARPFMSEELYARLVSSQEVNVAMARMNDIAREAAYQGKLKLNKSSARIYGEPKDAAKPAPAPSSRPVATPAP